MIHFGTDGWRAVIADEYTMVNVAVVAQAVSDYLHVCHPQQKISVAVGYDARFMSGEFARKVASVLSGNDIDVVLSDRQVPTPVVSFVTSHRKLQLGIMITASHNPSHFNGFKIKTPDGGAADKSLTDEVEKLLRKNEPRQVDFSEAVKGKKIRVDDFTAEYIRFLKTFIDYRAVKKMKVKVLVDLMHGSGGDFLGRLFKDTSIKVTYMHDEYNPSFGGRNPEPTAENVPELIRAVKKGNFHLGVALDGDGDRIALVTGRGEYVDAQVILPLLALHMIKNRKTPGGIAKTVVGSNLIDIVARDLGAELFETSVGFKYISALFEEDKIAIGGEEAGGLGYKGFIPERDGNMSALLALEMMALCKESFTSLVHRMWKQYGRWYYDKIKVTLKDNNADVNALTLPQKILGDTVRRVDRRDGVKMITDKSWLMLRKSGTEPILRIYAESTNLKKTLRLLSLGKEIVRPLL